MHTHTHTHTPFLTQVCASALHVAAAYMFRLKRKFAESGIQTPGCSAQLFAVCLMMATKYLYVLG